MGKFVVCFMKICTCSSTGGILVQASHVPRGPSQRPLILQFTNKSPWFPFYSDVNSCECHFSVTARYVKKKLPSLREVRNDTVWRTFERLGYSYKARRRKAAVAEKHKPARLAYCDWVEKQDQEDFDDWSYVDGTSIYLATHEA